MRIEYKGDVALNAALFLLLYKAPPKKASVYFYCALRSERSKKKGNFHNFGNSPTRLAFKIAYFLGKSSLYAVSAFSTVIESASSATA